MKISPPTLDGGNPYQDELTQLRIDRLAQRLTLLSTLLPIAIVVILALGYVDLKRRVAGLQDSGAATVQTLSDDLMSRFSTLSVRVAELEAHLEKTMADAAALRSEQTDRLTQFEARLKDLETEQLAGRQLKAATETLAQQVASLTERLDSQDTSLKTTANRLEGEIRATAASIQAIEARVADLTAAVEPIREEQAALAAEVKRLGAAIKRDREASQQAEEKQKEAAARQLKQSLQPLGTRLQALENDIGRIKRALAARPAPAQPSPSAAPASPPAASSPAGSPDLPDLEPGQIIEKPLQ